MAHTADAIQVTTPAPPPRSLFKGFITGAGAACLSATITNPMEVVKTRLQLQGELVSASGNVARIYKSAPHAFMVIARAEGIRGLQRGLIPAYWYQALMNGTRLGFYEPVKRMFTSALHTVAPAASANAVGGSPAPASWVEHVEFKFIPVLSGFTCGISAALLGSPLFLTKTRMQSYSSDPRLMGVGTQHRYRGTMHAFSEVVKEGGIKALWRGCTASMMRTGVGSAVQLSSYDAIKDLLLATHTSGPNPRPLFSEGISLHFTASMLTGFLVAVAMNPFDMVMTRMYNQGVRPDGSGALYSGPLDCAAKTWRSEGIRAFGKGFTAHYLRIGPHTILTFVFLEQLRKVQSKYWP
ncbi:mitochondrial carrier domain-containing protein [Catenaria anguillulae PL171]|uniref:Mitochondrial carrier domain-containing protein n=1 Tax=Catenaria anguillulae PL171 TaxID=765915 RepID=A0A1Y2HPN8_9FUNG|nr:mitochondrial carrier domain-containing protein [Catenaria anguillulae PL171]